MLEPAAPFGFFVGKCGKIKKNGTAAPEKEMSMKTTVLTVRPAETLGAVRRMNGVGIVPPQDVRLTFEADGYEVESAFVTDSFGNDTAAILEDGGITLRGYTVAIFTLRKK